MVADDLRETLLTARQAMGADAHPIHVARLQLVWRIVQWAVKEEPEHWQRQLEQAERAVDSAERR
jgi:hypothetical protein